MRFTPPLALATLLSLTGAAVPAQDTASRPNVLLILADDLGFSDLSCYGSEIPTPNLDLLAAQGARFSQFYNSARCCPSRASLLTGLHPHQAGVGSFATQQPRKGAGRAYAGHLLADCATLAELLGDAGYSTWMVGKWHLGTPGPIERGFQNYWGFQNLHAYSADQWDLAEYARLPEGTAAELSFGDDFYATDAFSDYALEFLRQTRTAGNEDRPWFLYLAHSAPHFPVQAPVETIDRYVEVYRRGWDALRADRLQRMQRIGLIPRDLPLPPRSMVPVDREDLASGYPGQPNPAWDSLPEDRREDLARRMATFAAMVEHVDHGVGRILRDLQANGELDDTLILFLSDNGACYEWGPFGFDGPSRRGADVLHTGEALRGIGQAGTWQSYGSAWANLGNTPLNLYKHFCHEGGISSPLIVSRGDRFASRSGWIDTPVHLIDVVPTVLEATGATYPERRGDAELQPLEGTSLWPLVDGESFPERALAFEHQEARALRRGRYKVVWGKRMPEAPHWELYDIETDRSEQRDLSSERPELTAELAALWEDWAKRVGADPFTRDDYAPVEDEPTTEAELIADRPLTITCQIDTGDDEEAHGVLVCQGGRQQGFALHLVDGVPTFDVRRNGEITRVQAASAVAGKLRITAHLDAEVMTVGRGRQILASRRSPGLIPAQPTDPREVGQDSLTAAGDYEAPNAFTGSILGHEVKAEGDAPRQPETPPTTASTRPSDYGAAAPGPTMPEGLQPLFDHWMRDTWITRGPDSSYYLTGTTATPGRNFGGRLPHCWDSNDGLYLWRSDDLAQWQSLGRIWSLDADATWQSTYRFGKPFTTITGDAGEAKKRAVWAPEIHWIESAGNWFVVACMNQTAVGGGSFVLRSTTGKPEGPYENIEGNREGPLFPRIDGSLFEDDDGSVWFVGHNHEFARMKPDMSGLAEPMRRFVETAYEPEPYIEGAFVFKHAGRYHLVQAIWSHRMPDGSLRYEGDSKRQGGELWSYDCVIASADRLEGPYGPRYTAGVGIGHDNLFRGDGGRMYATLFGNPRTDFPQPFRCRPAMVEMCFDGERFRIAEPAGQPERVPAPNFVVILTDDQGWGTTSTTWDPAVPASASDFFRTPSIDRLAARGMRFTQAYAANPNCSPSRAALLTGQSPAALHFTDICGRQSGPFYVGNRLIPPRHVDDLDPSTTTIPELLKAHDPRYVAAHFGKWHLRGGGPEAHGFDGGDGNTGNGEGNRPANLPDDPKQAYGLTDRGLAWMREQVDAGRPFYLQLSHYATHLAYQSRPATRAGFETAAPGTRHTKLPYAAMLADLDRNIGRVLDALDALGIAENTYLVYTADNGTYATDDPANANGPVRGHKAMLWEGGVRVPMVIAGPGIDRGSISRVPAVGYDVLPTIAALAGISSVPAAVEGADLTPALHAKASTVTRPHGALHFHWPHYQHQKRSVPTSSIVEGRYKLQYRWETDTAELYDLEGDLAETTDLAAKEPEVATRLQASLFDWLDAVDAQRPQVNPDFDPEDDPALRRR